MAGSERTTRRSALAALRARARSALDAAPGAARSHRALLAILTLAILLRAAVSYADWPSLFLTDSWQYLRAAVGGEHVAAMAERPSGYPMLIHLLGALGPLDSARSVVPSVIVLQHLAGLAGGVVAYALLLKLGVRRWLAATAAALVLLDSYAVSLEQNLQPESLFSLALLLSAALLLVARRHLVALAASGVLLAGAATFRTAALFGLPVWLLYVIRTQGLRGSAVAVAAAVAPLLAYSAWYQHNTGTFGMTRADGWFLYGRVGPISGCRGLDVPKGGRPLCASSERERRNGPNYFVWNAGSPAVRAFGPLGPNARVNATLRTFAFSVIRQRPADYARIVMSDFGRFFWPEDPGSRASMQALTFPRNARRPVNQVIRDSLYPSYQVRARAPSKLLVAYQRVFHTPRWLFALLGLAGLASLALAAVRRGVATRRGWDTLLLIGMPLAVLLGSVATVGFEMRFLLSVLALLVTGGILALEELWQLRSDAGEMPGHPAPQAAQNATFRTM